MCTRSGNGMFQAAWKLPYRLQSGVQYTSLLFQACNSGRLCKKTRADTRECRTVNLRERTRKKALQPGCGVLQKVGSSQANQGHYEQAWVVEQKPCTQAKTLQTTRSGLRYANGFKPFHHFFPFHTHLTRPHSPNPIAILTPFHTALSLPHHLNMSTLNEPFYSPESLPQYQNNFHST